MKNGDSPKINSVKFAFYIAIVVAVLVFLITILAVILGFANVVIVSNIYGNFGYSVSMLGAFVGALYSFIDVFILMWIFAWIYNRII